MILTLDGGDDFFTPVLAAARAGETAMRRAFRRDVGMLRAAVDLSDLSRELGAANVEAAVAVMLPESAEFPETTESWRDVYKQGGRAAARDLSAALQPRRRVAAGRPVVARLKVSFDATNPEAVRHALEESAKRITAIIEAMRDAIRQEIAAAFTEGRPPRELARRLIDLDLGLDRRRAQAVRNFEAKLMQQKISVERIETRVGNYAEAQLRQRSLLIARTETIDASASGQRELWRQAESVGLINRETAMQEWVATPDERLEEICESLDGTRVKLGEPFESGGEKFDGPPGPHPGCRCTVVLVV